MEFKICPDAGGDCLPTVHDYGIAKDVCRRQARETGETWMVGSPDWREWRYVVCGDGSVSEFSPDAPTQPAPVAGIADGLREMAGELMSIGLAVDVRHGNQIDPRLRIASVADELYSLADRLAIGAAGGTGATLPPYHEAVTFTRSRWWAIMMSLSVQRGDATIAMRETIFSMHYLSGGQGAGDDDPLTIILPVNTAATLKYWEEERTPTGTLPPVPSAAGAGEGGRE